MKNLLIAVLLLISTLTYSQLPGYDIKYNDFPIESQDSTEWVGTEECEVKHGMLLVVYCANCHYTIIEGRVIYRRYYDKAKPRLSYWDIECYSDRFGDRLSSNVNVLGFRLYKND
jgi:hypothetical protein